jgi:hypothetical protein
MIRMASHALSEPRTRTASAPPHRATGAVPARTIWKARPMAWVADEQALTIPNDPPLMPQCMVTWLAGALAISRGTVSG